MFQGSIRLPVLDLVTRLRGIPGARMVAYLGSVQETQAVPVIKQRINGAHSTNVAAFSGATYTSKGYAQSMQSALNKG